MADPAGIGVFVLGMHRSGTSATSRALNLLGVPLAAEEELTAASPNNPTGFWEVGRLTRFNNELLNRLGGSSLGPPVLEEGWARDPELERKRGRGRAIVEEIHHGDRWVWKDPRNCVTFPFWREALPVQPVVVLCLRDPPAVARSLATRQGLSAALSFAVWERYTRQALTGARGLPVHVTRYADLVGAPSEWAREAATFLRQQGVTSGSDGGEDAVTRFIESGRPDGGEFGSRAGGAGRRRQEAEPSLELSESQRALSAAVESLVGRHRRFEPPELPAETVWTEPLLAERRRADMQRHQMEERMRSLRRTKRGVLAARAEAEERLEQALAARGNPTLRRVRRRLSRRRRPDGPARGRTLPDFLIIGAQKCGTSSLFRWLGESPHVALSSRKEVHFFDLQFHEGVDWYRSYFPPQAPRDEGRGQRPPVGESSPYYLFHPLAAQRVRQVLPEVRLIVLVRNPVHRAVSHYYHEVGNGFETLALPAALDREEERLAGEAERIAAEPGYVSFNHRHFSYQARGLYMDQLEAWGSLFPRDRLLVVSSERLFERPREEMARIFEFLEAPGGPPERYEAFNQRDYPSIPPEVEERLTRRFADHNARLYRFVGDDFGWPSSAAA